MVNLIQDLCNEWNSPHFPISISVTGINGYTDAKKKRTPPGCWDGLEATKINCRCGERDPNCTRFHIILSQFAASNVTRHPELECCVVAMETRGFWRSPEFLPIRETHHFHHNAESYYLVGKAMAKGMLNAIPQ